MNKGDLIELVAGRLGESKASAGRAVEAVLESIAEGVVSEDRVAISGFGTFRKSHRKGRQSIHPVSKQPLEIAPSVTVQFKASQALKDQLD